MSEINDIRVINDFRISSFSKYKKTDVTKALTNSLINYKIENACYWMVEMICTGMYFELWTVFIKFISKYIYIGNPQLPKYISKRINDFKEIVKNGYIDNELYMRNNDKVRSLFAEILAVIITSKKKNQLNDIKLSSDDYQLHVLSSKFLANNTTYIKEIYNKDDPKETFMAFNEFAFNISKNNNNTLMACYWIEWIIEYEQICKKNKTKCVCERRVFANVDPKFQMSIIWIIWEILLHESNLRGKYYYQIVNSLLEIFCLRYTLTNNKKFKHLFYYAIYLLCENIDTTISFINDKSKVSLIVKNIDKFFKQIKLGEESPKTDYLFDNKETKTNREKTFEKLQLLNKINK